MNENVIEAGDTVEVINPPSSMNWSKGSQFIVSEVTDGCYIVDGSIRVVGDSLDWYTSRFKLIKKGNMNTCNGVDAQGNPKHFTAKDLKPFMRGKRPDGRMLIVVNNVQKDWTDSVCFTSGAGWLTASELGKAINGIVEIYEAPDINNAMLTPEKYGKLLWKMSPPKTQQQLDIAKLEATVADAQAQITKLKASVI